TMIESPDIAAAQNRDVRFERGPQRDALAIGHRGIRLRTPSTAPAAAGGEGRTPRHMVFSHQFEDLGCGLVTVLDRLDTGKNRPPHAFDGAGMYGHGDSRAPGSLHRELHLLERKGRMRSGGRPPAIVTIQLHPIGAVPDLVAYHSYQAVDAV